MIKKRYDSVLNTTIKYNDNEVTSDLLPIMFKNIPNEKIFHCAENSFPIPFGKIQELELNEQLEKYKSFYFSLCYSIKELEKYISTNKIYIADKIVSKKVSQNEIDRLTGANKKNKAILKENIRNKELLEKYIESIESKTGADNKENSIGIQRFTFGNLIGNILTWNGIFKELAFVLKEINKGDFFKDKNILSSSEIVNFCIESKRIVLNKPSNWKTIVNRLNDGDIKEPKELKKAIEVIVKILS